MDLYILFNLRHLESFFGHGEENKKCLELNFIPENGPGCEDWPRNSWDISIWSKGAFFSGHPVDLIDAHEDAQLFVTN